MALDSYDDLLAFGLRDAEEDTDGTSEFNTQAVDALVASFRDIVTRHPWLDLRKYPDGALLTVAPVTSLTVTAAAGTAVTGSISTAHAISLADYVFVPAGKDYFLRVTSHTAATTVIVFDVVPEALTAQAGTFAKIEYDAASDLGLFMSGLFLRSSFIPLRPLEELITQYPVPAASDAPPMFARVGARKIRLAGWTSAARRIDYPYTTKAADPSGSSALVLPDFVRPAIGHAVASRVMELKGDPRWKDRLALSEGVVERAISYDIKRLRSLGSESNQSTQGPYSHAGRRRGRW